MKSIIAVFMASVLFSGICYSQLTKGTWLAGGNGIFSIYKVMEEKTHYVELSPNLGYFFVDKLAGGFRPGYTFIKNSGGGSISSTRKTLLFGPFVRYYLLNDEKPFNLIAESSYLHGMEWLSSQYDTKPTKYSLNVVSFSAGPVIYFNSSVGLEFLLGYAKTKYNSEDFSRSQLQLAIGFQIHLEK